MNKEGTQILVEVKCISCTRVIGKCIPRQLNNVNYRIYCYNCALECEDEIASLNSEGEVWDRDAL